MLPTQPSPVSDAQDQTFTVTTANKPSFHFHWHDHPLTEITFFAQGQGLRFVGDHVGNYQPNQLILLGPNLPHTCVSQNQIKETNHQAITLHFNEKQLNKTLLNAPELWPIKALFVKSSHGLLFDSYATAEIGQHMEQLIHAKGPRKIIIFLEILNKITQLSPPEVLTSQSYTWSYKANDQARIKSTLKFLSENYTQPIHLDHLADIAHMSPSAFSRFFKKQTKQTPSALINHLRVSLACKLLTQTPLPILDICYESGFHNVSNFNRRFKDHQGVSPREFRKQQAMLIA